MTKRYRNKYIKSIYQVQKENPEYATLLSAIGRRLKNVNMLSGVVYGVTEWPHASMFANNFRSLILQYINKKATENSISPYVYLSTCLPWHTYTPKDKRDIQRYLRNRRTGNMKIGEDICIWIVNELLKFYI